ncbi:hypothetical protein AB0H76_38185 [Nocardia sp. NPDC050712]|uniref:hypothetical protein n=1 Tax=Nocardia sp. NPDC050712 TaxID=3155518 RepID=UPI0033E7E898
MTETLPLITDPGRAREVLTHCPVPPVDRTATTGMAWLRAHVPRFSDGAEHRRRRALVLAELARIDPSALRVAARTARGRLAHVQVLAEALGLPGISLDAVELVATHYQPHTPDNLDADRAVDDLVAACGGVADEATAARISLLVQAYPGTAALADNARGAAAGLDGQEVDALLERTVSEHPPIRSTRRIVDGVLTEIELATTQLAFSAGPHQCPGRAHALAIAAGLLAAPAQTSDQ